MRNLDSIQLSDQDLWLSTIAFGVLAIISLVPLLLIQPGQSSKYAGVPFTIASAIFWGIMATIFMRGFWDIYYAYFYPDWVRRFAPGSLLIYSILGSCIWWIAQQIEGTPGLWLAILGGLEGILEHAVAIYGIGILKKVPMLAGISSIPALVFSFFEYALYWTLTAWIAWGISILF
jgi:hypothetical protein